MNKTYTVTVNNLTESDMRDIIGSRGACSVGQDNKREGCRMKRSEMLSKIASVIINYNEAHCIINREKAMEMADTILQVQEEKGMHPPLTKAKPFDFTNTGFTQEFLDEHEFKVNRWEPEDD